MKDKRNDELMSSKYKLRGRNRKWSNPKALLLILKWGGELTAMGREQAEHLGKAFRCVYPESRIANRKFRGVNYSFKGCLRFFIVPYRTKFRWKKIFGGQIFGAQTRIFSSCLSAENFYSFYLLTWNKREYSERV